MLPPGYEWKSKSEVKGFTRLAPVNSSRLLLYKLFPKNKVKIFPKHTQKVIFYFLNQSVMINAYSCGLSN